MNSKLTSIVPSVLRSYMQWVAGNAGLARVHIAANYSGIETSHDLSTHLGLLGTIVFNIEPKTVKDLIISDGAVSFTTVYGGVPVEVCIPVDELYYVYCLDTDRNPVMTINFVPMQNEIQAYNREHRTVEVRPKASIINRSHLKVVK